MTKLGIEPTKAKISKLTKAVTIDKLEYLFKIGTCNYLKKQHSKNFFLEKTNVASYDAIN